ncbi:MAG: hypothetical protein KA586_09125 [Candidatus Promineofilum sp.]|nr:hypothetical protein [Promineifilum sp.]
MTTKRPASGNKNKPQKPDNRAIDPRTGKKLKSAGFIESSDFKPNWLETGPLSPDMLPDPLVEEDAPLTPDEFDALQTSLKRFYEEVGDDELPASGTTGSDGAEGVESALEDAQDDSALLAEPVNDPARPEEPLPIAHELEEELVQSPNEIEEPAEALPNEIEPSLSDGLEEAAADLLPEEPAWLAPLLEAEKAAIATPSSSPLYKTYPIAEPVEEPVDVFVDDEEPEPVAVAATVAPTPVAPKPRKAARPKVRRRPDRLSVLLLITSLLLLGAAALVYYVNPFSRIALGAASLARPVSSPSTQSPAAGSGEWCLAGEFLPDGADRPRLMDSGANGDILAEDMVFSLEYEMPDPGTFEWQVVDCNNDALIYPADAPAWATTTEANQAVTFNFDSDQRADPLFFPIPYVVSAIDATNDYRLIGDFQDWNPDDPTSVLQQLNIGLHQQVRRIARSGSYEAYIIAADKGQAMDAYGRTTDPIPFSFETERNGEYVVFLVDTDRGRASIMYDMPPLLTSLAYGDGNWILSLALVGLASLLLLGLIARWIILHSKRLQMEAGCPNCGRQELMRISRRPTDRALHLFGIPAYRYRCRNCVWEGTRLSQEGTAISPGVKLAYFDE